MTGTGWACVLGTLTCTRADVLAANASYPLHHLDGQGLDAAQASIINTATVSGGGEANSSTTRPATHHCHPVSGSNSYLSDSGNFSQGAKGVQYGVTIQNLGNAPTTGTVTLAFALGTGLTATSITAPIGAVALRNSPLAPARFDFLDLPTTIPSR